MRTNDSKKIGTALREIQGIAAKELPFGKYMQIVNRCAKIALAVNKQARDLTRGTGYTETVDGNVTQAEVAAMCEKMNTDKVTVLAWLHERPVTTLDCIDNNMLRASDIVYRLRKDGWPIGTRLVKAGRARIAKYYLMGERRDTPQPFVALKSAPVEFYANPTE